MNKIITFKVKAHIEIPISDLKAFQGELKKLSEENQYLLRKHITKDGFNFAPHVWKCDKHYYILDGHQRIHTLRRLVSEGYIFHDINGNLLEGVPCNVIHATDIADAKKKVLQSISQFGKLDVEGYKDFVIDIEGFDAKDYDFPDFEVPEIEVDDGSGEGNEKDDDIPEVEENVYNVARGDIWQLGMHRLMCGDSTDKADVDRLMDGEKADMVFTDPPYNQETDGGFKSTIGKALEKQSKSIEHLCSFVPDQMLEILPTIITKKVNATLFCNKDLIPEYLNWARSKKYSFNVLVWKKPSAIPIGGSYSPDIEYIIVIRKNAKFNRVEGCSYSKVIEHGRDKGLHPTMKPIAIIENQLLICSDKKDVVADLFGGSGSTLIACEKTDRRCYMCEIDPHYCSVIIKRYEDYTGEKAFKL